MEIREAVLFKDLIINDWLPPVSKNSVPLSSVDEPLLEDYWAFGYFWPAVVQTFSTVGQLYGAIDDLYRKLQELKERYRPLAAPLADLNIVKNQERGISGSYFMVDEEGKRHFIIKPLDEDAGCIHSDRWASPFLSSPLRADISLYSSAMREALAYHVALAIGCGDTVPKTTLGILESSQFHEFTDRIALSERKRYLELCSSSDKEKLCSVQEYVQNAKTLFEAIHDLEALKLSDEEIASRFDQQNFEEANLLLWTTFETDGHMNNFLVYPKGVDAIGNEILALKKIDNGLAFPDQNRQLRNHLSYLPNAKRPLSEETKQKIASLNVDLLAKQFEKMGLESAIPALRERIPYLKSLALEAGLTIKEINQKLSLLGKKE